MKGFKISKTALLILASGAFVIVLGGLGIMRYGQISEEDDLNDALSLSAVRLNNMDIEPLQLQLAELQEQLLESESQLEEAKTQLIETVISVDVTDTFYEIASFYGVIVDSISTTKNQSDVYEGVACVLISINAAVSGDLAQVIDFIAGLNNNFSTGFVISAQITIDDTTTEDSATGNILMVVYTYEGS